MHQRHMLLSSEELEHYKECTVKHAARRALERAAPLSEQDIINHALLIRWGKSRKLGVGGGKRELHELVIKDHTFFAVFDVHMNRVVTYLRAPAEWKGTLNEAGKTLVKQARMCLVTATPYHGD